MDGTGVFLNFHLLEKCPAKSTGLGLDPETVPHAKVQNFRFPVNLSCPEVVIPVVKKSNAWC